MKRPSTLSLLLVLLLAACQLVPPPIVAPPQVEMPQSQHTQDEPASAGAAPKLLDEALGQKLQAALEAAVDSPDTNWPGAVLYVSAPGLGVWSGTAGLGEVETNTPMRPHDRFRAGSLTKPFIAAVTLQLVEEGRFALDDPITTLLPDQVAAKIADSDKITVRMLLNHTSGVPDFMDLAGPEIMAHLDKVWDAEEFIDFAAAEKPSFAPGEAQYYSNTGYILLGMVIEEATGQAWRQELRQRIFEPLNLADTLLPEPDETTLPGDHAHGYADFGGGIVDATELATASVVGAAGGQSLVTTAPDLARFLEALLTGQLFQESGTLEEMLTFVPFAPDHPLSVIVAGYGLGVNQISYGEGLTAIGHSGDTEGGYHAFVYHFPEQAITISGAVNVMDPAAGYLQLMPRVLEVLVPGYTMPEPPAPEQPDAAAALQGLLNDQVREQGILGMVMAVRLPDGTVVAGSSGSTDPAGENPWTLDTVSALGSVTKSFVGVVIMQLVEEEKLSLDDTIDAWFPDQPNADKITVRMLLSHTSGLANFISSENVMDPKWVEEWEPLDLVAEANRLGPVGEPGSSVAHYANTNYILLGLIIEAITGNTWKQEVRSRIIEPLDLQHTGFIDDEGVWGGTMVPGYFRTADGYISTMEVPYPHSSTSGSAGVMVGTVADLLTFAGALFDGALVSKETLAEMATPLGADAENGVVWGLGGATVETLPGAFGMEGGIPGYSAFFIGVQDTKLVVATLLNSDEGDVIAPSLMALDYLISGPPAAPLQTQPTHGQADVGADLQGLLDSQVREQGILGMAMAVRLADGTVVGGVSGYTDPAGEDAWSLDTVSALGSITKSFTGVVIMQLVEEGKLSLDDTIDRWFADQPNGDKITVRMLLSHTSGLANFISPENERDPKWANEWAPMDLVAEANKRGPVAEPGTSVAHYANTNYFLLGLIIEEITGNSWTQEVRSRIIDPLDLKDTTFVGEEGVWGGILVPGYFKTADGYISALDVPSYPSPSIAWAAGAVVSTLSDLMTFASALFDGVLVSKETLAEMATPVTTADEIGRRWGLGGAMLDTVPGSFGMGGDAEAYHAFFMGVQDTKFLVVALVNTAEGDVITPSLMAFQYVSSLPPAGQEPVTPMP